jgi:hypothetical protein
VLLITTSAFAVTQSLFALGDGYYELAKHNVHAAFATGLMLAVLTEVALGVAVTAVRRRTRTGAAGNPGVETGPAPAPLEPASGRFWRAAGRSPGGRAPLRTGRDPRLSPTLALSTDPARLASAA